MRIVTTCGLGLLAAALVGACSSSSSDSSSSSEDAVTTSTVHLMYEGTCNFLHTCSTYSRRLPAGQVQWGCEGAKVCSDSDAWMAGPNKSYCGKSVTICNGSRCTTGVVRDISDAHGWEAGDAVLGAIGLSHGLTSRCSGYGGGTVTIKFGAAPAPPVPPPKPPPPPPPGVSSQCDTCTCDGDTCGADSECCSGSCTDGTCDPTPIPPEPPSKPPPPPGASSCARDGDYCYIDSECCSRSCGDDGACAPAPTPLGCIEGGNNCDPSSGGMTCCSGSCNPAGYCE